MIRFLQRPSTFKKIIYAAILGTICLALVITLVPGGTMMDFLGVEGAREGVVARVGRRDVTVLEVQQVADQMGRRQFPRGIPQQLRPLLVERAAQNLILQRAMMAEATRLGFTVSDDEVRAELQTGPLAMQLFPGGQYVGEAAYANFVLQNFNMTIAQFQQLIAHDLLVGKLRAAIEGGVTVSEADVEREFRRRNTSVRFRYAVVSLDQVMKDVRVTEEEMRAFFDRNQERYRDAIPEARRARFIIVDRERIEKEAQVTRSDLQSYYNQNVDQFRLPEQVEVRHILVRTPPAPAAPSNGADQAAHQQALEQHRQEVEAARKKAEDILRQVRAGESFEQLARRHSDDPGSKEEGGLLGRIERGQTVPEFEQAAFTVPKGEVSDLVQTTFGFHILRVEDRQASRVLPLDEVRPRIEPMLREDKVNRMLDERASALESQARSTGLEDTARRNNLELVTTDFLDRSAGFPNLGRSPDLMEAVFSARERGVPESVQVRNGYAIVDVPEVRPARTPEFEEIRARVEQDFRAERAQALLAQRTEELSDRARAGADLRRAARELGAELKTSEWVTVEGSVPDIGPMSGPASVAFGMKPNEISPALPANRNGVVLQVTERRDPDMQELHLRRAELREGLLEQKRSQVLEVYLSELRRRMEQEGTLRVNQQEMDRITAQARLG